MWRARGLRPGRSARCCSTSRVIVRRALKSQVHDGCVSADSSSCHVDQARNGLALQVSIQQLSPLPAERQHALSLPGPISPSDGVEHPALGFPERPAAGSGEDRSCDCAPSTSASASGTLVDALTGNGRWRGQSSRDAAALTRRITRTQSTPELQAVVQKYRAQLNPIHVAAAIVKLAKLTAVESGRRRERRGLAPASGEHAWRGVWDKHSPLSVGLPGTAADDHLGAEPGARGSGIASSAATHVDAGAGARAVDLSVGTPARGHNPRAGKETASSASSGLNGFPGGVGSVDGDSACGSGLSELVNGMNGAGDQAAALSHDSLRASAGPSGAQGDPPRSRSRLPALPSSSSSAGLLLADLVPGFLSQLPHYSARQFANVVWALGSMGSREHPELLHATAVQLQAHNGAKLLIAQPQELSNLALGLAKLGYREVPLWAAIIAAGKRRLHEFKPQELHNMAWAVASASQDRSMISAAVQAALPQLRKFNASGLANLLWACAAAQCPCEELFDAAAMVLIALPPEELNFQDVANTAWACAKLQHSHPQLMAHLARIVLQAAVPAGGPGGPGALRSARTQELVNLLWAFSVLPLPLSLKMQQAEAAGLAGGGAGVGVRAEGPLGHGGLPGVRREDGSLGERQAAEGWQSVWLPGLESVSTPSGSDRRSDPGLRRTPAGGSPPQGRDGSVGTSSSSGLAQTGGGGDGALLEAVVRVLLLELSQRADISPQGASNVLWACACLQPCPLPAAALTSVLDAAMRCAPRMSDQEISNTLWAVAQLRGAGLCVRYASLEPVFAVACCAARLETMAPAALAQLVHAAVALRQVPTPHMDLLAQQVMARLPVLGPQELCVLAVAVSEAVRVCRYCNPILLNGLANAGVACVAEMCPQAITTLLWSFARAKHYHGPLTTALCRAAKPRLRDFNDLELSNLVCALAVLKCQDRQLLVQAARVLVERVRFRRQRRAMAAAVRRMQDDKPQQNGPQHSSAALLQPVGGERGREADELRWGAGAGSGQGQLNDEEQEDVELAWASQRHQQQQRRRRRQQEQQQQQQRQSSEEADVAAGPERGTAGERPAQGAVAAATAPGDAAGSMDGLAWHRNGWDGAAEREGSVLPTFDGATVVPAAGSPRSEQGARALTAAASGRPARAADAAGPSIAPPEAQLRLRRLPYMHNHHDNSLDAEAPLQPRRPPAREVWGEAAASGRRGSGSSSSGSSMDTLPSAVPRCVGLSDAASSSSLTQRSMSSMDEGDADLATSSARARSSGSSNGGGGGAAAATADPPTPRDHAKSMSKLLWSYAKCNLYNQSLFKLLTQELQPVLRHTTPHELTLSLWAVACHSHRCPDFLDAAAGLLLRGRVRDLCPWDCSVVAWAFAKLGHSHRALFEALQQQARAAGPRYKEPSLLRLAWACAAMEVPLHDDLLRRVVAVKQQGQRRGVVHSSYDGADGEVRPGANAARVEVEW